MFKGLNPLNGEEKVIALRFIYLACALFPFVTAGYFFDDVWNATTKGGSIFYGRTVYETFDWLFKVWTFENGRFYPVSQFLGVYGWYFLDELWMIRAYQVTLITINIWLWFYAVKLISNSADLAWWSILLLVFSFQFNPTWDALTSFAPLMQMLVLYVQLALIFGFKSVASSRKNTRWLFLFLALSSCVLALGSYELGLIAPILLVLLFLVHQSKQKSICNAGIIFCLLLIASYLIVSLVLRFKAPNIYPGTSISLTFDVITTFFLQTFSAFPIVVADDFGDSFDYVGPFGFSLVTAVSYGAIASMFMSNYKGQGVGRRNIPFLIVTSLLFLSIPSLLIGLSVRYQSDVSFGNPYIVVYAQYFGSSLLLAIAVSRFVVLLSKHAVLKQLVLILCSILMSFTLVSNLGQIRKKNEAFKFPRQKTENVLRSGYLSDLKAGGKIYVESPFIWESSVAGPPELCSAFFSHWVGVRIECLTTDSFVQSLANDSNTIFYLKRWVLPDGNTAYQLSGGEKPVRVEYINEIDYTIKKSDSSPEPVVLLGDGFYGWEPNAADKKFSWSQQHSTLKIVALGQEEEEILLSFTIKNTLTKSIKITFDNQILFHGVISEDSPRRINLSFSPKAGLNNIEFDTEDLYWQPSNDNRKLYFWLGDVVVSRYK